MIKSIVVVLVLNLLLSGAMADEGGLRATAELKDKDGKTLGMANFQERSGAVIVTIEVKGVSAGLHAVHLHTVGKCDAPGFTSAGGHFNPLNKKHGLQASEGAHAGDFPNILVGKDGVGRLEALTDGISLKAGEPTSVFDADGSAVIIHAAGDDYVTDPTGNAGDRVACGVLGAIR